MKKIIPLLAIFFSTTFLGYSQKFDWLEIYTSSGFSTNDMATVVSGNNVYVAGEFRGSISFGSTVLNAPNANTQLVYVANFDTLGNFRWASSGGSNTGFASFLDFDVDKFGNVYIIGTYSASFQWGNITMSSSGTGSPFSSEGFIFKLSSTGSPQWVRGLFSPTGFFSTTALREISVADSSVYFGGVLSRSISLTNSTLQLSQPTFQNDAYVGRLDLSGNFNFLNRVVNTNQTSGTTFTYSDLEAESDSTFYLSGNVRGVYTFGSNNRSLNSTNTAIFVSKFTNSNCDWLTNSSSTVGFSISGSQIEIKNGNVYLGGTYSSSLTIQGITITTPPGSSPFTNTWFASKFNSSGTLDTLISLPVIANGLNDIAVNSKSEMYLVGSFRDSISFAGTKRFTNGNNDILILNLDSNFNENWFQTGGGGNADVAISITSDNSSNAYLLGNFRGLSQFGSTFFTGNNAFNTNILTKLSECGNDPVSLSFNGDTNLCAGQFVRIQANTQSAANFQWLKDSISLAGEVFRDLIIDSTGNYQVIVNSQGCVDTSRAVPVQVGTPPTVTLNLNDTICEQDAPVALTGGTPVGGTYKGQGVVNNTFDPSLVSIGNNTITYVFSNGGCQDSASATIFVKPAPTVFFAPIANVCITSSPITLTNAFPFGGVFSGTGVSGSQFNPAIAGGGFHTITYTFTDANGCIGMAAQTVEVDTLPITSLSTLPTLCSNSAAYALSEGSPSGGVYQGVGVTNGVFDPIISGAGTFNIDYTITNQCGSSTSSQTITVNLAPTVTLGALSDVCEGSGLVALSGGTPTGGTYSGVGVSGSSFDPVTAGVGTFTIFYDFTDAVGCSSRDSSTITVNALPITTITNDTSICNGSSIDLTATGGTAYLWSNSSTTATINVSPTTTTQYFVTVTNASNCTSIEDVTVTVNPTPTASISGTTTICEGSSTTLTASGGQTYIWDNTSTNSSITVSPTVSTTYTVTITDINGCTDTESRLVTVNPSPTVTLGALSDVCEGSGLVALSGGTPTGGTYSGVGVSGSNFDPVTAGVGTFTIFYDFTDAVGCSSRDSSTITVNALPITTITNDTSICNGSSINLTATGGTAYLWSNSSTTATINVSPTTTTQYFVTVTNASNCTSIEDVTVTVNPTPTASISGTTTICEGSSTTLTASGGQTYIWDNTSTNSSITVSPTVSTTYTVTITDINGCTDTESQLVTVNPAPTVTLGALSDVCEGSGLVALSGGTPTGGTYSGVGVSGSSFDPVIAGVGTFTIFYDFTDAVGCSSRDSSTITVNALPITTITNDTSICNGSSIDLTATGGTAYLWSNSSTTATINVSPTTTTQYFVTVTNASNCTSVEDVTVTVNPTPTASISGTTTICEGSSTILTASGGQTYIWDNTSTNSSITVSPTVSTTYTVTITDINGCTDTESQLVTVNPAPTVTLGALSDVCEGSGLVALSGGTPTGGTYSGVGVSGSSFDPVIAGVGTFTIFYDFTDAVGCSSRDSSTITVNALPITTITNDTSICNGSSIDLTATGGTTYLWSNSSTTATINVSPTTTTQYFVTVTNASNCTSVEDVTVTVDAIPSLTVSNDTSICIGDTIVLSANSNATNFSWSTSSTSSQTQVFPLNTTYYYVTATNSNGCTSLDSVLVTVNTGTPINIGPDTILDPVTTTSYTYDAGVGFSSYLWQDNSTNQTITVNYDPAKAGVTEAISVIVGNSSGCPSVDTAFVFYDFNISLDELDKEQKILIMPNPVDDRLNIQFSNTISTNRNVRIFDLRGKLVYDNIFSRYEEVISIDILDTKINKGVYLLLIETEDRTYQEKIIVN